MVQRLVAKLLGGIKMAKPFSLIRAKLVEVDIDQKYLAELLGISISSVSRSLNNERPWLQTEQYKFMDEFNIPYCEMHLYFPKDGITVKETGA